VSIIIRPYLYFLLDVGKTSLLQCLRNQSNKLANPSENLATDGIEMTEWQPPPGTKSSQAPIKFQCFDFGGQVVYYPTYVI
jgi:hypothetical protein